MGCFVSPADLIPDFIPVPGYADDLLVVPLLVAVATRMVPPDVMAQGRAKAKDAPSIEKGRLKWIAAGVIVLTWILGVPFMRHLLLP